MQYYNNKNNEIELNQVNNELKSSLETGNKMILLKLTKKLKSTEDIPVLCLYNQEKIQEKIEEKDHKNNTNSWYQIIIVIITLKNMYTSNWFNRCK